MKRDSYVEEITVTHLGMQTVTLTNVKCPNVPKDCPAHLGAKHT
jgi:hypothetical protein